MTPLTPSGPWTRTARQSLYKRQNSVKTELEIAQILINSSIVKSLRISKCSVCEPFINNIKNQTLQAVLEYKNHPSINIIQAKLKIKNTFTFVEVNTEEIEKDICMLNLKQASQYSDIPNKIIKESPDMLSDFLCSAINSSIKSSLFPSCPTVADVTPVHKKGSCP